MADEAKTYTQEEVEAQMAGLKQKNADLIAEQKRLAAQMKAFEGVDPERFKVLVADAEKREREKATAEGDFKKLEEQYVKRIADMETNFKAREGSLLGAIQANLIDAQATAELARHSDSPELLLPHIRSQMRVIEVEPGKFAERIVDKDGTVRIGKTAGAPMTLPELVEEMRGSKVFAPAFRGSGSSGGGAQRSAAPNLGPGLIPATGEAFLANLDGLRKGDTKVASGA